MIKILTVVGARPQFIKAATLSRCIAKEFANDIEEIILHSGQHYDENMSANFFKELNIPAPKYHSNLQGVPNVDKVNHMRNNIELAIHNECPDAIILYGDTNTTLAGTYAASNTNTPIIHIEAGLRSYNESMPEEFNRYTCDHASTLLFAPTPKAIKNLKEEELEEGNKKPFNQSNPGVYLSGDVMYDSFLYTQDALQKNKNEYLKKHQLKKGNYILATIHRNFNTDNNKRLENIFRGFDELSKKHQIEIVLPLHPKTKKRIEGYSDKLQLLKSNPLIKIIEPLPYNEMLAIGIQSKLIITDSGGLLKESFFMQKPCLVLRDSSEWTEIIENGNALLVDDNPQKIMAGFEHFSDSTNPDYPSFFGNGKAAQFICKKIIKNFG